MPRSKSPVMDAAEGGGSIVKWIWQCRKCRYKTLELPNLMPYGWVVDDIDDLDNTEALCDECVDEDEEPDHEFEED